MIPNALSLACWLVALSVAVALPAAAQTKRAEEGFPPIEEILGELDPPAVPNADFRDAVASKPSLEWIVPTLRSKDQRVRRSAVNMLATPGNVKAVPYLGAILLRLDEEKSVRITAATGLGRIGSSLAGDYLIRGLEDPVVEVRFASALALGRINPIGAVTRLAKVLRDDSSWWVRYAAAVALGRTRQGYAVDDLQRAALEDSRWQVRLQAARSLGELRTERAASALGEALKDSDDGVRAAAILALGECGGENSLELLKQALERERDAAVRGLMTAALRRLLSR